MKIKCERMNFKINSLIIFVVARHKFYLMNKLQKTLIIIILSFIMSLLLNENFIWFFPIYMIFNIRHVIDYWDNKRDNNYYYKYWLSIQDKEIKSFFKKK